MRVLALIPARGGSKGIPRKNIRTIAGKPLISWTIEAALSTIGIDDVVVSTDDEEIADVARRSGAAVPFIRPADLATDQTPGIDPVLHALGMMPDFDAVVLLQPTSPLRTPADIEAVLALDRNGTSPSVVSVCAADAHPAWMYTLGEGGAMIPLADTPSVARRQDLDPVYALNGAIYYAHVEWLKTQRRFVGPHTLAYVMPVDRSVDIDTPLDWRISEMLLQDRR
jgi:CMP-N,N'-diacetyllegionaminic acid synthase